MFYFGLFWFVLNYWDWFFVLVPSSRNFSLVVCYSLKFIRCLLLVVKSLVTRCKICSLLVAKESLVTCRRSCSLQKTTRYLLQNSLVTRCRSFLLQKIAYYSLQNLLVAKNYSLQNLLITRWRSCSFQKIIFYSLQNSLLARCRSGVTFYYFIKKDTSAQMFSYEFLRNVKNIYSVEHLWTAASENNIKTSTNFLQFLFNVNNIFHFYLIKYDNCCWIIWLNWTKYRSNCLRVLLRTVVLKNLDMFQENTGGGGLVIFRKVCLINIKRIRKHVNSILHKVPDIWHFILQ